jgi:hypothetical protein
MNDEVAASTLNKQAINAALGCRWQEALEINLKLKALEPENTEYLNRLAKANFELGKYTEAKKLYQEVLKLDPYKTMAEKNYKRISAIKKDSDAPNNAQITISASSFLDEPGTTKSVNLVKVAEPQRLLVLSVGTIVNIVPKNRGISITDQNDRYLGAMPDDISFHIMKLIKGGNKYEAFIRAIKPNGLTVLIREIYRSKKFKNQASFLDETRLLAFTSDSMPFVPEDKELPEGDESEEMAG